MTKRERRELERIAQRANNLLRQWGIGCQGIKVEGRNKEVGTPITRFFWGFGMWENPDAILKFEGAEVGAYCNGVIRMSYSEGFVERKLFDSDEEDCIERDLSEEIKSKGLHLPFELLLALCSYGYYLTSRDLVDEVQIYLERTGGNVITLWIKQLQRELEIRMKAKKQFATVLTDKGEPIISGSINEVMANMARLLALSSL